MKLFSRFFKISFTVLIFIFLPNTFVYSQNELPNFYDNVPNEKLAASIIEHMTDEELLAQTFMFGWAGQEPDGLLAEWIEKSGLGSIKIFGWNTQDSRKLAQSVLTLQKKAYGRRFGIPLFVATDQEGGWVRHVKGLTSETPGNLAIGASGIPQDAYYAGYYISRELRALGINLNFAPSVDLLTDLNSTIIGSRSFGDSPEAAGVLGVAFMRGSKDAGVLTTAKHFPGHGDTSVDSHGRLPKIDITEQTLYERELVPFKYMVDAGVPAIMAGHLNFQAVSPNGEPATFSKRLLTEILRGEMKFGGLIITDDMMMFGAIHFAGGIAEAVRMALEAGNDIIESSTTPRHYQPFWSKNLQYLKDNPHFKARVKDAAYRILLAKLNYFKTGNHVPIFPDPSAVYKALPDTEGEKFFLGLAARSVTVLRGHDIPFKPAQNERILLASNYSDFFKCALKRFPNAKTTPLRGTVFHTRNFDTLIYCLSDDYSLDILRQTVQKYPEKKIIVISVLSPAPLKELLEIKTAICIYSYSPVSFTAGFAALCGDFKADGNIPVSGIK